MKFKYYKHRDCYEVYRVYPDGQYEWYPLDEAAKDFKKKWHRPSCKHWMDFYDTKYHKPITMRQLFVDLL